MSLNNQFLYFKIVMLISYIKDNMTKFYNNIYNNLMILDKIAYYNDYHDKIIYCRYLLIVIMYSLHLHNIMNIEIISGSPLNYNISVNNKYGNTKTILLTTLSEIHLMKYNIGHNKNKTNNSYGNKMITSIKLFNKQGSVNITEYLKNFCEYDNVIKFINVLNYYNLYDYITKSEIEIKYIDFDHIKPEQIIITEISNYFDKNIFELI